MKLSGSPSKYGLVNESKINNMMVTINPVMSLNVKYGWNGILSKFLLIPIGLLDPVWWRKSKWIITNAMIINGIMKWKVKNRDSVALSTANPPHTHWTKSIPK